MILVETKLTQEKEKEYLVLISLIIIQKKEVFSNLSRYSSKTDDLLIGRVLF